MSELHKSIPMSRSRPEEARRAIVGGFFAVTIDAYDIYLPAVALSPALTYFEPGTLPLSITTTIGYFVLAATFVGRPVGAFLFGYLGDRLGRRRTTLVSISGFAVLTLLMATLPGYASWGYLAVILLTLGRFVDGVFMGGGYTGATPLAMEACPKRLRGLIGGVLQSSWSLGQIIASVATLVVLSLTQARAGQAYVTWGWRIPFVIGGIAALLFLVYYVRVPESDLWENRVSTEKRRTPLRDLLSGRNLKNLIQVFVLMSGLWFATQSTVSAIPGLLEDYLKQPVQSVTIAWMVGTLVLGLGYISAGFLSQRFGRRPMLIVLGVVIGVPAVGTYYLMVHNAAQGGSFVVTAVWVALTMALAVSAIGIMPSYINERFPTHVRASGYGVGYSAASIIPALYSFWMIGLSRIVPYGYTPLVLLVIAGILTVIGAAVGPETRHVDLENVHRTGEA